MWPRRQRADDGGKDDRNGGGDRAAAPSMPTRPIQQSGGSAGLVRAKLAKDDDCAWLLRAQHKKSGKPKTALKKRAGGSEHAASTARPSKLRKGLCWTQPVTKAVEANASERDQQLQAAASAGDPQRQGESFDDVFAEIVGGARMRSMREVDGAGSASAVMSSSNASSSATANVPRAAAIAAQKPERPATQDKWAFETSSAIALDAFDAPVNASLASTAGSGSASFARWKAEDSSHAVSDNFVRLHMRKRVKGSTGKARKVPEYMRARAPRTDLEDGEPSANASTATKGAGVMQDGVDFIDECLDAMTKQAKAPKQAVDGSSVEMTEAQDAPQNAEESVVVPRCHHTLPCQRLVVKKKNANHGRAFFACSLSQDEGRCAYFLWEDNHAQFALQKLLSAPSSSQDAKKALPVAPLDLSVSLAEQQDAMLNSLRVVFGHAEFREGQQWAIERVLQKKTTLLVLPTGAGKSLCYQFPALFLPGLTIVVSPLLSLMHDQYDHLPPVLQQQAACVTAETPSKVKYAELVRNVLQGEVKLLFVSPEKALTQGFQHLLARMATRISLICIDEAHCISEWSHHFRPSYLRLAVLLQQAPSVLALTATASRHVERDILMQLMQGNASGQDSVNHDPIEETVRRLPWQRDNLRLAVIRVDSEQDRLDHVTRFLAGPRVSGAVIVYVHQQWQTESLAAILQEQLAVLNPKRWSVRQRRIGVYHAGMDAEAKEKVRQRFLSGRLSLVIATIAFGMGIDKANVRCVIHFNVPSSIEHYLQQIGRAGRDGRQASAVLYLLDDDVRVFRSLLFSNALHYSQLQRLVKVLACGWSSKAQLVGGKSGDGVSSAHDGHIVAVRGDSGSASSSGPVRVWIEVPWLEQHVDMKDAMIETFLTWLTQSDLPEPWREVVEEMTFLPVERAWGVLELQESRLASADPRLRDLVSLVSMTRNAGDATAAIGHVDIKVDGYLRALQVRFHIGALAQALFRNDPSAGTDIDHRKQRLLQEIRQWQWQGKVSSFRLTERAFQIEVRPRSSNLTTHTDAQLQSCTMWLNEKHQALEARALSRLECLYGALSSAAVNMGHADSETDAMFEPMPLLEARLTDYLENDEHEHEQDAKSDRRDDQHALSFQALTEPMTPALQTQLERDMKVLVTQPMAASAIDIEWNGVNIARVLHGLASPCFPTTQWRDDMYWRKYTHVAFEQLVPIADSVLHLKQEQEKALHKDGDIGDHESK